MHKTGVLLTSLLLVCCQLMAQQPIDRHQLMDYLQNQQYNQAVDYLLPKVQSTDAGQIALLAYTYYQAGKPTEAITQYEKVLTLNPDHIAAHQYLAALYMQQERYPAAIDHYQQLTRLQPNHAGHFKQLSFAWFAAQQPDTAFPLLQKAWQLNPADPKVTARLGEEWLDRKNYTTADSLLQAYLRSDSTQAPVIMVAVRATYFLKNYVRCTALGEQLMRLNIASPNTFSYVTAAYFQLKQYQQCIAVKDYLMLRNAAAENILYYAAMAHTQLKQFRESNTLLQLCISMAKSPGLDNYYSGMSANYEAMRQYKPAVASLDTAWYLFHQPLRQYSIGRIYEVHLKNKPVADRYYKRYLQVGRPSNENEADIYKYLRARIEK
ncbi:tetratricopeptide repeat protein [Chitinophaga nivalis]|uniref:Tetratricopeptide repeat protein n=1 Tax=Chitinophaga nivalis TaxID=2991709 RepID=A0ABT3IVS8_9BACT|nr:tetratricopeptide repeat protein [Chitinophaga nivalis]MCW3462231.1 tetratricopeptide repeat protein [Chitinophaga nivalis]MCW3488077.1 tetratricopeptide repeat protein [Chitinophaga nivalis]